MPERAPTINYSLKDLYIWRWCFRVQSVIVTFTQKQQFHPTPYTNTYIHTSEYIFRNITSFLCIKPRFAIMMGPYGFVRVGKCGIMVSFVQDGASIECGIFYIMFGFFFLLFCIVQYNTFIQRMDTYITLLKCIFQLYMDLKASWRLKRLVFCLTIQLSSSIHFADTSVQSHFVNASNIGHCLLAYQQ